MERVFDVLVKPITIVVQDFCVAFCFVTCLVVLCSVLLVTVRVVYHEAIVLVVFLILAF